MNIQLDKLKGRPREIVFDDPVADFPGLVELTEREGVVFTTSLRGKLKASWAGDVIEVTGTLATSLQLPCSRCLEDVPVKLEIPIRLCYSRLAEVSHAETHGDQELDEDELGLLPIVGDEIDLRPDLEHELMMFLPQQPLCKPTCAGLCPVCGGNLNQVQCQCDRPVFHSGLEALKKLKLE